MLSPPRIIQEPSRRWQFLNQDSIVDQTFLHYAKLILWFLVEFPPISKPLKAFPSSLFSTNVNMQTSTPHFTPRETEDMAGRTPTSTNSKLVITSRAVSAKRHNSSAQLRTGVTSLLRWLLYLMHHFPPLARCQCKAGDLINQNLDTRQHCYANIKSTVESIGNSSKQYFW